MLSLHIARFTVDATPPTGHPLCGGWINPVIAADDPLLFRGVVLSGGDAMPVVLAALDWTGVMDQSHRIWCEMLAEAAHTTPDRVALHCVHQHNAPFVDLDGNGLLRKAGSSTLLYDERFLAEMMRRSAAAVRESLTPARPVTHVRVGAAEVKQVASNRRVLGPDGKVQIVRLSAMKDPVARAAPDGTIDPMLKSIGFFQGERPLARLYYYTTHPMSFYGDGRVTSDFVGLARDRRDADELETLHVYFTGSAGNITAGKYNEGTPADRLALTNRVYEAMAAADRDADERPVPLSSIRWTTAPIHLEPREDLDLDRLKAIVADPKRSVLDRHRTAMICGWLLRVASKRPIVLSKLELPDATLLHLPAETFVEYQLDAQKLRPGTTLATAAYGDGGPWYIPLSRSFAEGGYEPTVANVSKGTEPGYRKAITDLLLAKV